MSVCQLLEAFRGVLTNKNFEKITLDRIRKWAPSQFLRGRFQGLQLAPDSRNNYENNC